MVSGGIIQFACHPRLIIKAYCLVEVAFSLAQRMISYAKYLASAIVFMVLNLTKLSQLFHNFVEDQSWQLCFPLTYDAELVLKLLKVNRQVCIRLIA